MTILHSVKVEKWLKSDQIQDLKWKGWDMMSTMGKEGKKSLISELNFMTFYDVKMAKSVYLNRLSHQSNGKLILHGKNIQRQK